MEGLEAIVRHLPPRENLSRLVKYRLIVERLVNYRLTVERLVNSRLIVDCVHHHFRLIVDRFSHQFEWLHIQGYLAHKNPPPRRTLQ